MKRFYTDASVEADQHGYGILLDARPIRTPARAPLAVPTQALAEQIADEWRAQGDDIDPASMMMTGFANAAIDHVRGRRDAFAAPLIAYAETDMLCYRGDAGSALAERQDAQWEPLLRRAEAEYGVRFVRIAGVIHHDQPAATLAAMRERVLQEPDFVLAAMAPLVTISGSIVSVLALLDGQIGAPSLWPLVNLEELWQAEQWGEDAEALAARELRRAKFEAAARFCELVRG